MFDTIKKYLLFALSGATAGAIIGYGFARVNMPAMLPAASASSDASNSDPNAVERKEGNADIAVLEVQPVAETVATKPNSGGIIRRMPAYDVTFLEVMGENQQTASYNDKGRNSKDVFSFVLGK